MEGELKTITSDRELEIGAGVWMGEDGEDGEDGDSRREDEGRIFDGFATETIPFHGLQFFGSCGLIKTFRQTVLI